MDVMRRTGRLTASRIDEQLHPPLRRESLDPGRQRGGRRIVHVEFR